MSRPRTLGLSLLSLLVLVLATGDPSAVVANPQYEEQAYASQYYTDVGGRPDGITKQFDFSNPQVVNNALLVGGAAAVGLIVAQGVVSNAITTNSNDIQTNTDTISTNTGNVNSLCTGNTAISNIATVASIAANPTTAQLNTLITAINNIITSAATGAC